MTNYRLKNLILGTAIIAGLFLFAPHVFAQPANPFVVQFENTPLFSEANFLPGDTVSRWVKVSNNIGETLKISVSAINVNNPDNLADVLYLQIKQGANTLYSGTLAGFISAGNVYLSDLTNGSQTQYDFEVTFDINSGDEYAGKVLGFDFRIRLEGTNGEELKTDGGSDRGGLMTLFTNNSVDEQQSEVLGAATFRSELPDTGGPLTETGTLFAGIFVLVMIGLVLVRKFVLK